MGAEVNNDFSFSKAVGAMESHWKRKCKQVTWVMGEMMEEKFLINLL